MKIFKFHCEFLEISAFLKINFLIIANTGGGGHVVLKQCYHAHYKKPRKTVAMKDHITEHVFRV